MEKYFIHYYKGGTGIGRDMEERIFESPKWLEPTQICIDFITNPKLYACEDIAKE